MQEQTFKAANGINVIYRHKPNKYDFKHLIVVFSGFLNEKPGNYDFINALSDCPADVIWINDNFHGMYSYYLCRNMAFDIRDAVEEFIRLQIAQKNLRPENITFTGYSKGGSAALYHGLNMGIKNIAVSVPQMKIGSYVNQNWKHVATHMMGEAYQNIHIDSLDKLIVNLLKKETDFDKNIYLLTSEADIQYENEIKPYLSDFEKYRNFNLLKTYSAFVREHSHVTSHHTALLLSIYYALASEAVPRFGNVNFFGSQPCPKPDKTNAEPYVDLKMLDYKDQTLFLEGVAVLKGVHIQEYSDINYELVLENTRNGRQYTKTLAKTHRSHLTRELFDQDLVVYDKGWFTTYQYKGVDISDIPDGTYRLHIKISSKGQQKQTALTGKRPLNKNGNGFAFESDASSSILTLNRS